MWYFSSRLLLIFSCVGSFSGALFSVAQASEEKGGLLSLAHGEAIQPELTDAGGHSKLLVVGDDVNKKPDLVGKKSEIFDSDDGGSSGDESDEDMTIKGFSEFSNRLPTVVVNSKQEKGTFSAHWDVDIGAHIEVFPWNTAIQTFDMTNGLSFEELDINVAITDGVLTGGFQTALLGKHGWLFKMVIRNEDPTGDPQAKEFQLVLLDEKQIHAITLLDANAITEEAKDKELSTFSKPSQKGGYRDDELVVLMADTSKPHFRSQLPQFVVYMEKKAVIEHEDAFKKLVRNTLHDDQGEMAWRQEKCKALISALKSAKENVNKSSGQVNDEFVKRRVKHEKAAAFYPGMEDFIFDPSDFQVTLGPVAARTSLRAGVQIALWGGEANEANWIPVHPIKRNMTPVLDIRHFPSGEHSFYEVLWLLNRNVAGKTYGLVLKPETLNRALVVVDLSIGKFRRNAKDLNLWCQQLASEVNDAESIVLVVGGGIQEIGDIRKHLKKMAVLHFPELDETKESYLEEVINKFQGKKDIYRFSPDSQLFEELNLTLKTIDVAPSNTLQTPPLKRRLRRQTKVISSDSDS
ncbi:hypothetical protein [Sansalvadorimonas verongulae]|uniref:hypothetical protein n=1 Tax=Sansalvadorimonas verongulae TaxID=2172824 RepID=UPI0012BBE6D6|nr:hypothetical protein [Sansalvadorimonas verongulae]MTI13061.1 hypothetical protein [Sansalvadorimonas verongulae]